MLYLLNLRQSPQKISRKQANTFWLILRLWTSFMILVLLSTASWTSLEDLSITIHPSLQHLDRQQFQPSSHYVFKNCSRKATNTESCVFKVFGISVRLVYLKVVPFTMDTLWVALIIGAWAVLAGHSHEWRHWKAATRKKQMSKQTNSIKVSQNLHFEMQLDLSNMYYLIMLPLEHVCHLVSGSCQS